MVIGILFNQGAIKENAKLIYFPIHKDMGRGTISNNSLF